jgi:hypothetical protein
MRGYLSTTWDGDPIPSHLRPRPFTDHATWVEARSRVLCPVCRRSPPASWLANSVSWVHCPRCGAPWKHAFWAPESQASLATAREVARLTRSR